MAARLTRKIRIAYVIGTLDVGGTEGQLAQLATRLDPGRFEVHVCGLTAGGPHAGRLADAGIHVEVIGLRRVGMVASHPVRIARALGRLVRFLRQTRPDIVHGFLFSAYVIGGLAARATRVPIVIAGRRSLGHFKAAKPHYLWVERVVNRLTDVVVANSEAVKADVVRQERMDPAKVRVIYNGVDLARFSPSSPDAALRRALLLSEDTKAVGVVANFIHYKGHDVFLEAWTTVARKVPGTVALLVGDGPLRAACEARAAALGLGDSVRFLGTRNDVPELLRLVDVAVQPSREEGFSNAILEAMAAGRPVVASAVGGNPEAIVHGETGLLVPPGDGEALVGAMLRLLEYPAERAAFGRAGRRRIEERFDLARTVRDHEALYESLAGPRATRARAGAP